MFIFLLLTLAILLYNGLVIFSFLTKTPNKLIKIGAGMIVGPLGFLLLLSIFSYLFKGQLFIHILFFSYFFLCTFLKYKFKKKISILSSLKLKKQKLLICLLVIYIMLFIKIYPSAVSKIYAGSHIYNGIATSFARGNYPTVLPWQPDFLTGYHHGTFILEGALNSLGPFYNILMVHHIFATFLICAIFLLVTGIAREYLRSSLCVIPAIFGLILFSGPIILTSGSNIFFGEFRNFSSDFSKFIHNLNSYPYSSTFQRSQGAGVNSLEDLYYIIFYTFGLAVFILFLYCLKQKTKRLLIKYFFLVICMILILSIDETFFLICLPLLFVYFLLEHKKINLVTIKRGIILALVFIVLFLIIQNPVRDSMLTPNHENPRFSLFYPYSINVFYPKDNSSYPWIEQSGLGDDKRIKKRLAIAYVIERFNNFKTRTVLHNGTSWTILNIKLIIFLMIISFFIKSWWSTAFFISGGLAYLSGATITNTYFVNNYFRFFNMGIQLEMFGIGFLLIYIFHKLRKRKYLFFLLLLISILILMPQLIINHARVIKMILFDRVRLSYLDQRIESFDSFIKPFNKRIIFIGPYSVNINAATLQGYFVPMGPTSVKVLTPEDVGIEFYDAHTTLSPYAIRDLKIDYVYVLDNVINSLSEQRIKQINDNKYFQLLYIDKNGKLYKVNDEYKNLDDDELSVKKISLMIPDKANVYLDALSDDLLPKVLILELSKRVNLIGFPYSTGGGNYLYIENHLPYFPVCTDEVPDPCQQTSIYKAVSNIDYILANPKTNPKSVFRDGEYVKIAEIPKLVLWKNIKELE